MSILIYYGMLGYLPDNPPTCHIVRAINLIPIFNCMLDIILTDIREWKLGDALRYVLLISQWCVLLACSIQNQSMK